MLQILSCTQLQNLLLDIVTSWLVCLLWRVKSKLFSCFSDFKILKILIYCFRHLNLSAYISFSVMLWFKFNWMTFFIYIFSKCSSVNMLNGSIFSGVLYQMDLIFLILAIIFFNGVFIFIIILFNYCGSYSVLTLHLLLDGCLILSILRLGKELYFLQNAEGSGLAPFDCWLCMRGIKTMALRVEKQQVQLSAIRIIILGHVLFVSIIFWE